MHAAIVTFWHLMRQDGNSTDLDHCLEQLGGAPGLQQYTVLRDGGQCALVMLFESEEAADATLESEAMQNLCCSEECWDVFIRRFESATMIGPAEGLPSPAVMADQHSLIEMEADA